MMMGLRFTSGLVTTEFSGKEQSGEKTWIVARVCDSSAAATEGQGHVNLMLMLMLMPLLHVSHFVRSTSVVSCIPYTNTIPLLSQSAGDG